MDNLLKYGQQAYQQYQDSQNNESNNQSGNNYGNNQDSSPYPSSTGGQQQDFTGGRQHAGTGSGDFGVQGGAQFNSYDNRPPQQYGGGGSGGFLSQLNQDQTVQQASNQSNEDQGLFASALSFLNGRDDDDDVDEQGVQQAHQEAYSSGNTNMNANSMGAAAAMQALKSFTSGSGGQQQQSGGGMQSQLIAMAMSEATKLFNQNGGASNGDKQDVVNSAAQTMMKLMLKNKVSGMTGGGSEGGMGSLFSMAQKFM